MILLKKRIIEYSFVLISNIRIVKIAIRFSTSIHVINVDLIRIYILYVGISMYTYAIQSTIMLYVPTYIGTYLLHMYIRTSMFTCTYIRTCVYVYVYTAVVHVFMHMYTYMLLQADWGSTWVTYILNRRSTHRLWRCIVWLLIRYRMYTKMSGT